eukprot:4960453-Pyramimonas_sp.AAC.1
MLAIRLREYGMPYVVGGDLNVTKAELEQFGILNWFDAECVTTLEATCVQSERSIDMFLVARPIKLWGGGHHVVSCVSSPACAAYSRRPA